MNNTIVAPEIFSTATTKAIDFVHDVPTLLYEIFSGFVDSIVAFITTLINGPPAERLSSLKSLFFLILNAGFIISLVLLLGLTSAWQGYQISYFTHVGLGMQPEDFANYEAQSEASPHQKRWTNDESSDADWERRVGAWKESIKLGAYAGWGTILVGSLVPAALFFYFDGYELWTALIVANLRASAFVWVCVLSAVCLCRMIVPSVKEALAWMGSYEGNALAADKPERKARTKAKALEVVSEKPELPEEAEEREKRYIMRRLKHSAKKAAEEVMRTSEPRNEGKMQTMSDFERRRGVN